MMPQRVEVLESNVGEIKAELSHTRAQMKQMMDMMQKLLQAKSADEGQQEEESGSSGRGDANDDSGGAGRALREKGAPGTRVVATAAIAAGRKNSSHSSRASDGSRAADDMSRRTGTRVGAAVETAAGGKCPVTAAKRRMDLNLPTRRARNQRFRLAWAR